jgi:2,4-dienoyl-CoA reductase-like NADH-dependent reductase (Old Yellow Enzyme family)
LFSPLKIGPVELKNRIVMTAHVKFLNVTNAPGPSEIAYIEARAKGGAGLIVPEATAVHHTTGIALHQSRITPENLDNFKALATAVHRHGSRIIGQIYHSGAQHSNSFVTDHVLWSSSELRGFGATELAHEMTVEEIGEVIEAFATAAALYEQAGYDGVEIHSGHGYLPQQFLSPLTNFRRDAYGGDETGRALFLMQVIEAVRKRVSAAFAVGVRITADELVPGGLTVDLMLPVAQRIQATGHVDYLSVSNGHHESYQVFIAGSYVPMGEGAKFARAMKPHLTMPVLGIGRVHTPELAEQLLAEGGADLVGMTRALVAEPNLPLLAAAGKAKEMRPCIGVNYCFKRVSSGNSIRCAVNPEAGREAAIGHASNRPVKTEKKITVVGGGPAGLQAAITAAEYGASVTIFERNDKLGGQLAVSSRFDGHGPDRALLDYFHRKLADYDVKVVHKDIRRPDELAGFDVGILATGSRLAPSAWPDRAIALRGKAWDGPALFDGEFDELIDRDLTRSMTVLVEQSPRDTIAVAIANHLVKSKSPFVIVTSNLGFAADIDIPTREYINDRLTESAIPVYAPARLAQSDRTSVIVEHHFLRSKIRIENVGLIVATGVRTSFRPFEATAQAAIPLHVIGDSLAPRGIGDAVREGYDAALKALGLMPPKMALL